jgi:DNA-directed RNA polymerase subunit RPC12/RpoP
VDHEPPHIVPPHVPLDRAIKDIVAGIVCSTIAGVIFGAIAGVTVSGSMGLIVGSVAGAVYGLMCSPAFIFALHQRTPEKDLWVLCGITFLISLTLGPILGPFSAIVAVPTWAIGLIRCGSKARNARRLIEKLRANICTHCDYDLAGNTTGQCPECGHRA